VAKTEDIGHGRIETRVAVVVDAKGMAEHHEFAGLKAFGRVESTRTTDGETETEVRFYALSRKLTPRQLLATARAHWQIERAALAARRRVPRGRRSQPQGQRPGQHRRLAPPRPRHSPPRPEQGIAGHQAETSRMG
jgi:hypothetical protein